MVLQCTVLCCLLAAWVCRPGLGVPLAPSGRSPAVGEWTVTTVQGRTDGVGEVAMVRGWLGTGPGHAGIVAKGQRAARSLGLGHRGGVLWARVSSPLLDAWLHTRSGLFCTQREERQSCCLLEKAAKNELAVGTP